jgi:hypothetical protein
MKNELDKLEAELRQIPPAEVPLELMEKLRTTSLGAQPANRRQAGSTFHWLDIFTGWRLIATATTAAIVLIAWGVSLPNAVPNKTNPPQSSGMDVSAVQAGHSLVASFDMVAQLPGGEPVRFRCREWQDDVVIHDKVHGVMISKSTPRIEVIPVRFETY